MNVSSSEPRVNSATVGVFVVKFLKWYLVALREFLNFRDELFNPKTTVNALYINHEIPHLNFFKVVITVYSGILGK